MSRQIVGKAQFGGKSTSILLLHDSSDVERLGEEMGRNFGAEPRRQTSRTLRVGLSLGGREKHMRDSVADWVTMLSGKGVEVVRAELGGKAGAMGAGLLVSSFLTETLSVLEQ